MEKTKKNRTQRTDTQGGTHSITQDSTNAGDRRRRRTTRTGQHRRQTHQKETDGTRDIEGQDRTQKDIKNSTRGIYGGNRRDAKEAEQNTTQTQEIDAGDEQNRQGNIIQDSTGDRRTKKKHTGRET